MLKLPVSKTVAGALAHAVCFEALPEPEAVRAAASTVDGGGIWFSLGNDAALAALPPGVAQAARPADPEPPTA